MISAELSDIEMTFAEMAGFSAVLPKLTFGREGLMGRRVMDLRLEQPAVGRSLMPAGEGKFRRLGEIEIFARCMQVVRALQPELTGLLALMGHVDVEMSALMVLAFVMFGAEERLVMRTLMRVTMRFMRRIMWIGHDKLTS